MEAEAERGGPGAVSPSQALVNCHLAPAAAVIPAPIAYIEVVAVKKLFFFFPR